MSKHSRERLQERYNIELSPTGEREIMDKIRAGESIFLKSSDKDKMRKFCYVTYKNVPIKVLYEKSRNGGVKQIVTVYPIDVEEYNQLVNGDYLNKLNVAIQFLKINGYIVYKRGTK